MQKVQYIQSIEIDVRCVCSARHISISMIQSQQRSGGLIINGSDPGFVRVNLTKLLRAEVFPT